MQPIHLPGREVNCGKSVDASGHGARSQAADKGGQEDDDPDWRRGKNQQARARNADAGDQDRGNAEAIDQGPLDALVTSVRRS